MQALTNFRGKGWDWLFVNTLSSVSIIFANKWLMHRCAFPFVTCLTSLHFLSSSLAGLLVPRRNEDDKGTPEKETLSWKGKLRINSGELQV